MKGGVLSNKVAFCDQQIGEPGPWGGSVTLEVTDPCKDLWPWACVQWEELSKGGFWQMQDGWKPEDQPGGQGHRPGEEVSWCQRQRNGKRQDLQVRVTEAAPQRSGTKFGDSLRQNRQQRTGGSPPRGLPRLHRLHGGRPAFLLKGQMVHSFSSVGQTVSLVTTPLESSRRCHRRERAWLRLSKTLFINTGDSEPDWAHS